MRKSLLWAIPLLAAFVSCTDDRDFDEETVIVNPESQLIHYWNFNQASGTTASVESDFSVVAGAAITYEGTGAGYMDDFNPGYTANARNGDADGKGIRARNPSDTRTLDFKLPTTGFKDIILQFATARTGSGATTQEYSYSLDGTNFLNTNLTVSQHSPVEDPQNSLVAIDFTAITGANDNANFKFRIKFTGAAAAGTSGNNRFDNVTLEGIPISGDPGTDPGTDPSDTTLYLFHYWNFNNAASGTLTSVNPDVSLIGTTSAAITYPGTGAGYMDAFDPGSAQNARNGDAAGKGIRTRNPSNTRDMLISASTVGYKNVVVKFATAKSSASGAATQNFTYTTDGTTFVNSGLATVAFAPAVDPDYQIVTLDFTGIASANNNANFAVKISFTGAEAAGSSGNDRFDNLTFEGNHL